MENKQGFIPWSNPFHYNNLFLSSSSNSFQENPRQRLLKNHGDDYKAFAWMRTETMSNANLQKRIFSLENEVVKLRVAMEKTEARAERASIQAAALEAHVFELKSRLDSMPSPSSFSSPITLLPLVLIDPEPNMEGSLQNQVNELKRIVEEEEELKFKTLMNQNGKELEKILEKNTELEKKLEELTASIAHLKFLHENRSQSTSVQDSVQSPDSPEEEEEEEERMEMLKPTARPIPIERYFMVLIFLISVLIGATIC